MVGALLNPLALSLSGYLERLRLWRVLCFLLIFSLHLSSVLAGGLASPDSLPGKESRANKIEVAGRRSA